MMMHSAQHAVVKSCEHHIAAFDGLILVPFQRFA